jgi:hypothetical protein
MEKKPMLRNTEIDNLMTTIILNLMPMNAKESNYDLWTVFDQLQAWKVNVEWQYPGIGTDRSAETAQVILATLKNLRDREFAKQIERVVKRHTLAHERKMNDAACGRVIGDWQMNHTAMALAANDSSTITTPFAENRHVTSPAA